MKTQTFVLRILKLGLLAAIFPILLQVRRVQAHEFTSAQLIDVYPRASEQFFQAGRDSFEREIQNLQEGRLADPEILLQIDKDALRKTQLQQFQQLEDPRVQPSDETAPQGNLGL